MTKVVLPRLNQTGANEWADVQTNDEAITEVVNGQLNNENLASNAAIKREQLEAAARPLTWYASSIIATEQNTSSSSYVELGTPDKIEGIVVPTGGKLIVNFAARMKSSVGEGGKAAIFIGTNQLINPGGSAGAVVEVHNVGAEWNKITTTAGGMGVFGSGATGTDVATGMMIGPQSLEIYIPAGTYTVSVKAKNEGGAVTSMRERKLYVEVHGF